ncbi:hypothetical protein HNQ80_003827 [Anaerosolibacter carboniphilus]|uniref:Peptidoglycan recognition protein family domain-containing protein n=1 Tax=Anaerosolibacter carboniphilus TaxID=1417629 RepID=A0A841KVM6_9FIRM|nr:N-acetylmuramoyl-L-alanine amidase [Anaerosolibacter carboniphilus]MBB6217704.1 hypothetical protein [Anaerosolibacter carboniphilus]
MRKFQSYTVESYLTYLRSIKITREIKDIHLHHTWKPTKKSYQLASNKEQVIYGMWRYHTETLGWQDIGQHVTVSPDGLIWDGRDVNQMPASITGHNQKAFAIEMIGNFDKGQETFEGVQYEAMVKLVRGLFTIFKTKNLIFHREHSSKTCPGSSLDKVLLLNRIQNKIEILGKAVATHGQMKQYLLSINASPKINCSVDALINYYLEEGNIEGVRGDIAFAQALKETGFFRYGGIVTPEQNNYAGLGALNGNKKGEGASFPTPRIGVRAHIQHLKGYATKVALKQPVVDPRYVVLQNAGLLGTAPTVTDLNGKWAVPGTGYGESILKILEKILSMPATGNDNIIGNTALLEEAKRLKDKISTLELELDKYKGLLNDILNQIKEM